MRALIAKSLNRIGLLTDRPAALAVHEPRPAPQPVPAVDVRLPRVRHGLGGATPRLTGIDEAAYLRGPFFCTRRPTLPRYAPTMLISLPGTNTTFLGVPP